LNFLVSVTAIFVSLVYAFFAYQAKIIARRDIESQIISLDTGGSGVAGTSTNPDNDFKYASY
jgi:hypothetical protein